MGATSHFERTDAAYAVGEREVVSTIEEAREQAREALAARLTGDILDAVPDDNDMQHVLELAASELRGPRPITDEMVEAAACADFEFDKESMTWAAWERADPEHTEWLRTKARAALEAAEGARR